MENSAMSLAIFNSVRGKGTVSMIGVRRNPIDKVTYVMCPTVGVEHFAGKPIVELIKGDQFEIPAGYHFEECYDATTGEVLTYGDSGEPVMQLAY